jgi:hypothetical protein
VKFLLVLLVLVAQVLPHLKAYMERFFFELG